MDERKHKNGCKAKSTRRVISGWLVAQGDGGSVGFARLINLIRRRAFLRKGERNSHAFPVGRKKRTGDDKAVGAIRAGYGYRSSG